MKPKIDWIKLRMHFSKKDKCTIRMKFPNKNRKLRLFKDLTNSNVMKNLSHQKNKEK